MMNVHYFHHYKPFPVPSNPHQLVISTISTISTMCCRVQTGTLTEGDLDLAGVCEVRDGQFQESVADPQVGKQMHTLSVAAVLSNGHVAHLHFDQLLFLSITFRYVLAYFLVLV